MRTAPPGPYETKDDDDAHRPTQRASSKPSAGTSDASSTPERRVIGAAHLLHGETQAFELEYGGRHREAFVLAYEGDCHAYLNECPHWSVDLDLGDGHFYDPDLDRIYCKNHGAIFSPTTGQCESGPCLGRSLVKLRARRRGDDVFVSP